MKFFKNIDWPKTLMLLGFIVWLVGEMKGATDKKKGNTTSEWYKHLPEWVKRLLAGVMCGVFVHLIEWRISDDVTVNVAGDATVEVAKEGT